MVFFLTKCQIFMLRNNKSDYWSMENRNLNYRQNTFIVFYQIKVLILWLMCVTSYFSLIFRNWTNIWNEWGLNTTTVTQQHQATTEMTVLNKKIRTYPPLANNQRLTRADIKFSPATNLWSYSLTYKTLHLFTQTYSPLSIGTMSGFICAKYTIAHLIQQKKDKWARPQPRHYKVNYKFINM
jgi:hypothetical protein